MILGVFEESVLKISGGIFGISGGADGARLVERRWWGGGWWGVVQRRKTVVGRWLVGVFATAALDACAPFIRFRRCCRWSVSLFVASSCLDSTNLSSSEVLPVEYTIKKAGGVMNPIIKNQRGRLYVYEVTFHR